MPINGGSFCFLRVKEVKAMFKIIIIAIIVTVVVIGGFLSYRKRLGRRDRGHQRVQ